jgi:hypothetical protein
MLRDDSQNGVGIGLRKVGQDSRRAVLAERQSIRKRGVFPSII